MVYRTGPWTKEPRWLKKSGALFQRVGRLDVITVVGKDFCRRDVALAQSELLQAIEQHVLDTYAGKQLSKAATDV